MDTAMTHSVKAWALNWGQFQEMIQKNLSSTHHDLI